MMDMISSLPDSLLCHILSFLPTRATVATSILSRRWRHLWKDIQFIDIIEAPFHVPELSRDEAGERFVAFVNGVLAQRSSNCHINEFRLSCDVRDKEDDVTAWIQAATGPYLHELHINLSYRDYYEGFDLPDDVFTCTSLVSLTLKGDVYLCDLPFVHLPSLENLELDTTYMDSDELLSGCPVLETLKLHLCWCDFSEIRMPRSLKRLTFEEGDCEIEHLEMVTPSLQYLNFGISSPYPSTLFSEFFPNMVEAHLDILQYDEDDASWVPKLLKALCRTKLLVFTVYTTDCLTRAPALDFPEFCFLLNLKLDIPCFNARFLADLLCNCHVLQVLMIRNFNWKDQTQQYGDPSGWTPPTSVPECVISQLKIFEFREYQNSADEHAFIAYLLQRGLVLMTMKILTDYRFDVKKKCHILNNLSTIPRGSTTCQLKFE